MGDTVVDLGTFEGRKITKTTIAVTNAGDGLSQKMKIDPVVLHQGDTVIVVMECEVGKVTFDPYDEGVCSRVTTLKAGTATIMDAAVVREAIELQADANQRAKEREQGVSRLDDARLIEAHDDGGHADELVPDCPRCAHEVALDEQETKRGAKGKA